MIDDEDKIIAPFTAEQLAALNRWQQSGAVHPFTCPMHSDTALIAETDGWRCPQVCDYHQVWAHAFMTDDDLLAVLAGDAR